MYVTDKSPEETRNNKKNFQKEQDKKSKTKAKKAENVYNKNRKRQTPSSLH